MAAREGQTHPAVYEVPVPDFAWKGVEHPAEVVTAFADALDSSHEGVKTVARLMRDQVPPGVCAAYLRCEGWIGPDSAEERVEVRLMYVVDVLGRSYGLAADRFHQLAVKHDPRACDAASHKNVSMVALWKALTALTRPAP